MIMKIILLTGFFAAASFAAPQVYQAGDVRHPKTGDLGSLDSLVAETINILPDITSVFGSITKDRSTDSSRVQEIMMEFLPITRKVMKATEKVDGKKFSRGEWDRFNAAEAVMPSVLSFMDDLREMDFFDVGSS